MERGLDRRGLRPARRLTARVSAEGADVHDIFTIAARTFHLSCAEYLPLHTRCLLRVQRRQYRALAWWVRGHSVTLTREAHVVTLLDSHHTTGKGENYRTKSPRRSGGDAPRTATVWATLTHKLPEPPTMGAERFASNRGNIRSACCVADVRRDTTGSEAWDFVDTAVAPW